MVLTWRWFAAGVEWVHGMSSDRSIEGISSCSYGRVDGQDRRGLLSKQGAGEGVLWPWQRSNRTLGHRRGAHLLTWGSLPGQNKGGE